MRRKKAQGEKPPKGKAGVAEARAEGDTCADARRKELGNEFVRFYFLCHDYRSG